MSTCIRLISPEWEGQVMDNHGRVFYDRIDDEHDVFVHSEEDASIRPTKILSFMHDEMHKLKKLVLGGEVSLHNERQHSLTNGGAKNCHLRPANYAANCGLFHWLSQIRKSNVA
jgi:hypothetical protein